MTTVFLALATFMNILDTTITNVSIPTIAGNLSVSPQQGTWTITSYVVSTAITVPLTGWLALRFGEVRLFTTCTLLFTLASVMCGMAPSFEVLVVLRSLQGAVAGPMIPLSQSLLLRNYPEEKRGMALAFWSMTTTVAPIMGPILGGYITDNLGWPWIFYINVPIGFLSAWGVWTLLRTRESKTVKKPVDMTGLALLFIGVGSLQLMLDRGHDLDWFDSPLILGLGALAVVGIVFFVVWELKEKHPVVDLTLFARRNYAVGTIAIAMGYTVFFAGVVIFPLWLQTQMDYTATWAGLATGPMGIMMVILAPIVGKNMHKFDLRTLGCFSFIVFAGANYWQGSMNTDADYWAITIPRFLQGAGMAFFFVSLTTLSLVGLPHDRIASAAGLTSFIRILGGGFGASLAVTVWDQRTEYHHSYLAESISPFNQVWTEAYAGMASQGMGLETALGVVERTIMRQSAMLAANDIFLASSAMFILLAAFVLLAKRAPVRS
jgi:DHA2 family multidrug resistance protein